MQNEVSAFRLNVMRVLYLMIFAYLGSSIWPLMFNHKPWDLMHGVACALLAALGALMAFGLRYPMQMLPMLLFELLWKAIWLVAVGLPLWRAGQLDADTMETATACLVGVVMCAIVIPWGCVFRNYVMKPGDRWRGAPQAVTK